MSESTLGLFDQAIASAQSAGQTVGAGEPENMDSTTSSIEETSMESESEENSLDVDFQALSDSEEESGEEQEASAEDVDSEEDSQEDETSESEVEYINVTDHRGRRRKVKVDYSDKDNIKRAFSMAAGARKWQAERDSLQKELENSGKKVENWDTVSNIYGEQGIQGLVNFLEGSDDAFDKLVDMTVEKRNWTPEQHQQFESQQAQQTKDRELQQLKQEIEDLKNSQLSAKEEAELSSLKAEINPIFDKYRFSGKLNNPVHEEMLDEMLWNNAMKQLESLPEGTPVSSAVANKVFRNYANNLRTLVQKEAEKKASKVVANKKRQVAETVQVKASKSLSNNKQAVTASDLIKEGRIGDLFKAAAARNKNFMK